MGIRKAILDTFARWILKQFPTDSTRACQESSSRSTDNKAPIIEELETTKTSIALSNESNPSGKDHRSLPPSRRHDHNQVRTSNDPIGKQVDAITEQQAIEYEIEPEANNSERDVIIPPPPPPPPPPPLPSIENHKAEQRDLTERQDVIAWPTERKSPKSINTKKLTAIRTLEASDSIDELGLCEETQRRLKESGIYTLGDLKILSLDGIRELLNFNENSLTELMASLALNGYKLPSLKVRSSRKQAGHEQDSNEEKGLSRITRPNDIPDENRFKIPDPPARTPSFEWIPKDQTTQVAGITLRGGMIYVGSLLPTISGENDPCLIDPTKEVAQSADFRTRQMAYWPSYSKISAEARRAYLNWLADGRSDPTTYIGYVFLFFYGLERRVVVDCKSTATNGSEIIQIATEVKRLLTIYGSSSKSFKRYAEGLLDWIAINSSKTRLYKLFAGTDPLQSIYPHSIQKALGHASVDKVGLPAEVALQWARMDSHSSWASLLVELPSEFLYNFKKRYEQSFGEGLSIQSSDEYLRCTYFPASSGLRDVEELAVVLHGVPNTSISSKAKKELLEVLKHTCLDLDASRNLNGKSQNPDTIKDEAISLLTPTWSVSTLKEIGIIKEQVLSGPLAIKVESLVEKIEVPLTEEKSDFIAFSRLLRQHSLFLIPDVESGASVPQANDQVIIYKAEPLEEHSRQKTHYDAANLALQLASAVAASDGDFSASEHQHLLERIKGWKHLDANSLAHIEANLRYLKCSPFTFNNVRLNQYRKKLDHLDEMTRRSIAAFIASVAEADGRTTDNELKLLQRIYKALGFDESQLFSDLHHAAICNSSPTTSSSVSEPKSSSTALELDNERIAQLQRDTEQASNLLASIFNEANDVHESTLGTSKQLRQSLYLETMDEHSILGLDSVHSCFARRLMAMPQWRRDDLLSIARELGLMLDGALESINEASFDKYDLPFSEGDDPVDINSEVLVKLKS